MPHVINSTLSVQGKTTISDGLNVLGVTNLSSKLNVDGDTNLRKGLRVEGNANIAGRLTVNDYIFPQSDGTSGQVLKTDGSGNLSFSNESGGSSLV